MEEQLDRKDLKIQALLEKVSSLTTNYENQVADLRVEMTILTKQLEDATGTTEELSLPADESEVE